jgi:ribosomal protein L24E
MSTKGTKVTPKVRKKRKKVATPKKKRGRNVPLSDHVLEVITPEVISVDSEELLCRFCLTPIEPPKTTFCSNKCNSTYHVLTNPDRNRKWNGLYRSFRMHREDAPRFDEIQKEYNLKNTPYTIKFLLDYYEHNKNN